MAWNAALAKKYFEPKKALIVDQSLNAGRGLRKVLMGHGFKADNVVVTTEITEAQKLITETQPHILITEWVMGTEPTIDLIKLHSKTMVNRLESSCLVMSSDSTILNLATMAELSVDSVLYKPYTFQTFQESLESGIGSKLEPSPVQVIFEKGKQLLQANQAEEAKKIFEAAVAQKPKFAPLYAAYAEACMMTNDFAKADLLANEGLKIDTESFRCMNILFDLYMNQKKYTQAYDMAATLHQKYPPSSNRLLDLVKLSIYCGKYEDILTYCNHFKKVETTDSDMNRLIIAALLISCRYFKSKNKNELCKEILNDAARIATKTEILQGEVLRYLIESGNMQEADAFYLQLSEGLQKRADIQGLRMEILFQFKDYSGVITAGQAMIKAKLDTKRTYELMIETSKLLNRSQQAIDDLISESKMRHPEK